MKRKYLLCSANIIFTGMLISYCTGVSFNNVKYQGEARGKKEACTHKRETATDRCISELITETQKQDIMTNSISVCWTDSHIWQCYNKGVNKSNWMLLFTLMMSVNLWYKSLLIGCRTRSSAVVLFREKYSEYVTGWPAIKNTKIHRFGFSQLFGTTKNTRVNIKSWHTYRAKEH